MTFDLNNSVGDIAWAPFSSTVFDLDQNKQEPMCEQKVVLKAKLTKISFNPKHPIIVGLHARGAGALGDDATKLIMEQLYDNALVTAGLMDDSRGMVARVNTLLEKLIASEEQLKK